MKLPDLVWAAFVLWMFAVIVPESIARHVVTPYELELERQRLQWLVREQRRVEGAPSD